MKFYLMADDRDRALHEAHHAAVVFALGHGLHKISIAPTDDERAKMGVGQSSGGFCDHNIPDDDAVKWVMVSIAGSLCPVGGGDGDRAFTIDIITNELMPKATEEQRREYAEKLAAEVKAILDRPESQRGINALARALTKKKMLSGAETEQIFRNA